MFKRVAYILGFGPLLEQEGQDAWQHTPVEIRRARMLVICRLAMFMIAIVGTFQILVIGFTATGLINVSVTLALFALVLVGYHAAKTTAGFIRWNPILLGLFSGGLWFEALLTGGMFSPTVPLLVAIPVSAAMLLSLRGAVIMTLVNIAALTTLTAITPMFSVLQSATVSGTIYAEAILVNSVAGMSMVGVCAVIMAWQAEKAQSHMRDMIEHESHMATHDQLSGLGNRNRLQQWFQQVDFDKDRFDLLLIDLDGFKAINDTYGHNAGDYLIKAVSARLREVCEDDDLLIRLGGDEFLVVAKSGEATADKMNEYGARLIEILSRPYSTNDCILRISASIGHARFPDNGKTPSQTLSMADKALYVAKGAGKRLCVTYGKTPLRIKDRLHVMRKESA